MTNASARLIVLVDGENFPAKFAEQLLKQTSALGAVVETRVYGHYSEQTMSGWEDATRANRLTRVDVKATGPNSTDFQLTIEAMDILNGRQPDALCIVSSDRGFSSLAMRVKAAAVRVYGFGEKKAKPEYRACFDDFFEIGAAKRAARAKPATRPPAAKKENVAKPAPMRATKITLTPAMILDAISKVRQDSEGWARLEQVGDHLRKANPALPRALRLWDKLQKIGELETRTADRSHFVRVRAAD